MNKINLEEMINENDTLIELSEECQISIEGSCSGAGSFGGGCGWPKGGVFLGLCF